MTSSAIFKTAHSHLIEQAMFDVMRERLPMGLRESGLENYYASRLTSGEAIPHYVRHIVKAILTHGAHADSVLEVGAGLGELPFWLAAEGVDGWALERNQYRYITATHYLDRLIELLPSMEKTAHLVRGDFPCAMPRIVPSRTLLVSTCLVFTATDEQEKHIVDGMMQYGSVIVDLARLVKYRRKPEEWPPVAQRFLDNGFEEVQIIDEYVGSETGGKIVWYRKPTA